MSEPRVHLKNKAEAEIALLSVTETDGKYNQVKRRNRGQGVTVRLDVYGDGNPKKGYLRVAFVEDGGRLYRYREHTGTMAYLDATTGGWEDITPED